MEFDTSKKGLETVFKPWQITVLRFVVNSKMPLNTRAVYDAVKINGEISRASVINFCNDMVTEGVFTYSEKTGKGGYQGLYIGNKIFNLSQLKKVLYEQIIAVLNAELGSEEK